MRKNETVKSVFPIIKKKEERSVSEILKHTKNIIKDTDHYNKYLNIASFDIKNIKDANITQGKGNSLNYLNLESFKSCKNERLTFRQNISQNNCSTNKIYTNYLGPIDNENNMILKKNKKILLNVSEHIEIFNSEKKEGLIYESNLIFNKEENYYYIIKDKIEYFKNHKNENNTTQLTKLYNKSLNNESTLTIKSISFEFKNLNDSQSKSQKFFLPFSLIPLFYYVNFENFKYILIKLFKFNDDFTEIIMNDENISSAIKKIKEYDTNVMEEDDDDESLVENKVKEDLKKKQVFINLKKKKI